MQGPVVRPLDPEDRRRSLLKVDVLPEQQGGTPAVAAEALVTSANLLAAMGDKMGDLVAMYRQIDAPAPLIDQAIRLMIALQAIARHIRDAAAYVAWAGSPDSDPSTEGFAEVPVPLAPVVTI